MKTLAQRYPRQCWMCLVMTTTGFLVCLADQMHPDKALDFVGTLLLSAGLLYSNGGLIIIERRDS